MARKALVVKAEKRKKRAERQRAAGVKVSNSTKIYNICKKCGKNGGYIRKTQTCRICFREMASTGELMGVTKSSW